MTLRHGQSRWLGAATKVLGDAQIAEAQKMAREWAPKMKDCVHGRDCQRS
jgi:hypothetical protein